MVLELCDEDGCFQGREVLSKKIDLSRTESQVGKNVLVCSSQRSGIDVVHVSNFSVCFVSVEADVVMRFGSTTWTVISSLRDLDRWLVYSVCSGCLTR